MRAIAFAAAMLLSTACAADAILLDAARANDPLTAIERLDSGVDVNATDATGATALHWAVYHDAADLVIWSVLWLLDQGA